MRTALAGASALVVVALVLGADLKSPRPMVRESQRDSMVERAAVRHLTESLARAVRDLVGPQHQPAIHAQLGLDLVPAPAAGSWPPSADQVGGVLCILLRPEMLDLPPPMVC